MTLDHALWSAFGIVVLAALAVDLGFFQRHAHVVRPREALVWTTVWVVLALIFGAALWYFKGGLVAKQYLAGWLIEKSLSVDNLFVFLVIFGYFGVPKEYESRILMWGIIGALVMRALFVLGGAALLNHFHWMMYVFGAILIATGIKLLFKDDAVHPDRNVVVRLFRKVFPVSSNLDGKRFFTKMDGKWAATPLFIVLIVVETTDVVFAVDSIPAIFAITRDPLVVYTSNVFAILGLRALYFLLAGLMGLFYYLKYGLVTILWFVGVKMILATAGWYKTPIEVSLAVIIGVLALSVIASVIRAKRLPRPGTQPPMEPKPHP